MTTATTPTRNTPLSELEGPLLDTAQAATYLNTSVRHIRRLRNERRLAFVKLGGKLRYQRIDLDEFIRSNSYSAFLNQTMEIR
ncbi:MAG: helix-turn-helix domain-containing protein [Gemmatimonadales bacterium]|jgi:excisionase family DNA binding protein|nr:helix-turn-helix domain-containing protein [Gemmatimonadales bacterium]